MSQGLLDVHNKCLSFNKMRQIKNLRNFLGWKAFGVMTKMIKSDILFQEILTIIKSSSYLHTIPHF